MNLVQWILVLLAIGIFFYIGLFIGVNIARKMIINEIKTSNRFISGGVVYRAYEHADLSCDQGIPEALQNIPCSLNKG